MQEIFEAGCSPAFYQLQGKGFDFPDLTTKICPHCKGSYLAKHGYYERELITVDFDGRLIIRRYICRECRKTISLLPSFCHPKRTYGIYAIIGILTEFYVKMRTVCKAVTYFFQQTNVLCTRQLLRHYRKRIEQNLNALAMTIIDIYALRGPPATTNTDMRKKVRQLLSHIRSPLDCSLKMFKRAGITYLTPQAN